MASMKGRIERLEAYHGLSEEKVDTVRAEKYYSTQIEPHIRRILGPELYEANKEEALRNLELRGRPPTFEEAMQLISREAEA
jgi:hypothetical protein